MAEIEKWHVLPVNDLKEHKESEFCECKPKIEVQQNGNVVFIHNSFDGREMVEMANEIINQKFIDYKGYRYWYEYKLAKDRKDICLATKDPDKYCNGFYLYSTKDPGNGKEFVVTRTNNSDPTWDD